MIGNRRVRQGITLSLRYIRNPNKIYDFIRVLIKFVNKFYDNRRVRQGNALSLRKIYQFLFVIFTGVQITGLQQLTISISISALSDGQAPLAGTVYLNLYFPTGKLFVLQVVPV